MEHPDDDDYGWGFWRGMVIALPPCILFWLILVYAMHRIASGT